MLVELDIQNFAVIKSLKVSFKENMTVLIGETGAGKSIIIDALSLLLGSRAQIDMIRSGESKAIITGLFSVDDTNKVLIDMCIEAGIPLDDNQLVICRELSIKGRSIVRINGQITTINVLKNLSQYLVDIHGQRDMQILMDQDLHINLLDNYANNDFKDSLCQYQKIYAKWQEIKQRLSAIRKNAQEIAQKHDILEYQLNELKAANLTDEKEDERVDDEYRQLTNYQKIMTAANYFMQLYEDEQGLSTLLDDGQKTASELA
ncbi:MAG: AAA family ATPase, partial [Lactobacillus iners]|nr:AAA family ATPase [Lactobacillus iners]